MDLCIRRTDDRVAVARWQNEVKVLQALLPKYHAHVLAHPNTLLVKFYGLHRVKPLHGNNVSPTATALCTHTTMQGCPTSWTACYLYRYCIARCDCQSLSMVSHMHRCGLHYRLSIQEDRTCTLSPDQQS